MAAAAAAATSARPNQRTSSTSSSRACGQPERYGNSKPTLIRLAGMLCIEQNDDWLVGCGYLSAESISLVLAGPDDHTDTKTKEEVPAIQAA